MLILRQIKLINNEAYKIQYSLDFACSVFVYSADTFNQRLDQNW